MPRVTGELQTCSENASESADLTRFSCGDGRSSAEATVNEIVASYATGLNSFATVRVTREMPSGALVGLVAIEDGGLGYDHPLFRMKDWKDPVYIAVLTLSATYRGGYLDKDGNPLSHTLLRNALQFIAAREGGPVPSAQAVIAPDNEPSRRLFEAFGFEMIPTTPELLYVRPRGLAIP